MDGRLRINLIQEELDEYDKKVEHIEQTSYACQFKNKNALPESVLMSAEICPSYQSSLNAYRIYVREQLRDVAVKAFVGEPRCVFDTPKNDKRQWLHQTLSDDNASSPPDPLYVKLLPFYFPNNYGKDPVNKTVLSGTLSFLLNHPNEKISKHTYLHMAAAAYWRSEGKMKNALDCYLSSWDLATIKQGSDYPDLRSPLIEPVYFISIASAFNHSLLTSNHDDIFNMLLKDVLSDINVDPCVLGMGNYIAGKIADFRNIQNVQTAIVENTMFSFKMTSEERQNDAIQNGLRHYVNAGHFLSIEKNGNSKRAELIKNAIRVNTFDGYMKLCQLQIESIERPQEVSLPIASHVSFPRTRRHHSLFYNTFKYGYNNYIKCLPDVYNRNCNSRNSQQSLTTFMICKADWYRYKRIMQIRRKETIGNRPVINETSWKLAEVFPRSRTFDKNWSQWSKTKKSLRMIAPRYSDFESNVTMGPWRRTDWPNSVDCQRVVSISNPFRANTFPQIFLSPENRGYVISELLTTEISISQHENLPMPWLEPKCQRLNDDVFLEFKTYSSIIKLRERKYNTRRNIYAEKTLKTVLTRLADRVLDEFEVGARINILLNYNIGPKWVAMNLAALYWRVVGNPYESTNCLIGAIIENRDESFIALVQLAQVIVKATGNVIEANQLVTDYANPIASREPMYHYIQGRLNLLIHNVDKAIQHFKDALDREPKEVIIAEDLLKIACSGKSTKPAISSQFPTVCCSPGVQNAVCIKSRKDATEECYIVDMQSSNQRSKLIYHRCNGVYTGQSKRTADFANIVSPFLLVFNTIHRKDDVSIWANHADGIQTVETHELPLDYGGTEGFFVKKPAEWWDSAKNEMRYILPSTEEKIDEWEEEWESDHAQIPPKPLSFLWIREKSLMMQFDTKTPSYLPQPSLSQIRRGLAIFPPPRVATMSCNTVAKLDVLFDNPPSTWVSVTAKGEDIQKYMDLRGPMPSIASLQPVCPSMDKYENSPVLGLDHLPVFALSDQFLFYKPEKALASVLKSLGNKQDSIEHIAARLHTAMLYNQAKNDKVNWLLCVLSSLYWRATGNPENAMTCLRCALHNTPPNMRDVALVSLANICHQAGLLNSALISAGAALTTSPRLVAIHFTLANIYASLGDYQRALNFYYSTLSLQSSFQPAKDRIRAIYCHSNQEFNF
ncbi:unnamed protein product [Caenorhabditis bovis]|uniref:Tetratricopeptide repeat protein n=1 Tax=Caenorhabditis bovis TaxID=2654633 RepID=A0A8S1EG10_9PELO|nr:unnamed protein product [Caenorhabditis bovis]